MSEPHLSRKGLRKQINTQLDIEVWKKVRAEAARQKITIAKWVKGLVEREIEKIERLKQ